jgi:hypothetical protein
MNACCVGGPVVDQPPLSRGAVLILAAMSLVGALIVFVSSLNQIL